MEALHSYLCTTSCNTGDSVREDENRAILCIKWWKWNQPIGASDEQNAEKQNIMSRTPVVLGNHMQTFYSEFLSWFYALRFALCICCRKFLLLKKSANGFSLCLKGVVTLTLDWTAQGGGKKSIFHEIHIYKKSDKRVRLQKAKSVYLPWKQQL